MSNLISELVIGIDFGTTHSGVSWAINGGNRFINVINNWPNPQSKVATSDKVSSAISYKNGWPESWGYMVKEGDTESLRWIKVLLEPDGQYSDSVEPVRKSNEHLATLNKTAVSVVADYLRFLWEYTLDEIEKKQGPNFRQVYALKVVMSVPAMWSPGAKERTLQAAREAGFGEIVQLVTEPEAAALATLTDRSGMREIGVGDCFVVCDAGGGTVDLISYEVEATSPLRVKECAIGNGELCGSVFLDIGFYRWILSKVGSEQWAQISPKSRRKMMDEFEYAVKRSFRRGHDEEYSIPIKGVKDDPANGIEDGDIIVPSSVIGALFDNICVQVNRLVSHQIAQIRSKPNRDVKAILLVGGFGESTYLYNALKSANSGPRTTVLQVERAWSSITRGATLWGLEHSEHRVERGVEHHAAHGSGSRINMTVGARLARYSYGIAVNLPFNELVHHVADRYWDVAEGKWYAQNQMQWFVQRGEEFGDQTVLTAKVYQSVANISITTRGTREFTEQLYYSENDIPPIRRADPSCKKLCEVKWHVEASRIWANTKSYKREKVKWRDCYFHVLIEMGNANLNFGVLYGDEVVARSEAKYPDQ